jgi:hypothetical protein
MKYVVRAFAPVVMFYGFSQFLSGGWVVFLLGCFFAYSLYDLLCAHKRLGTDLASEHTIPVGKADGFCPVCCSGQITQHWRVSIKNLSEHPGLDDFPSIYRCNNGHEFDTPLDDFNMMLIHSYRQ